MMDNTLFAEGRPLNAFAIKILACLFMLADHIGYLLFPGQIIWRMIGRLAFPLFAFMIANGWRHSHNRGRYFLRLAVFALLLQLPYARFIAPHSLNIFFTLSLGIVAIRVWEAQKKPDVWAGGISVLAVALAAEAIGADYGWYGVLLIFTSHLFYGQALKLFAVWLPLNIAFAAYNILTYYWANESMPRGIWYFIQPLSLAALLIIANYNGREGKKGGWLFYVFYPLHLALLYLTSLWI